MTKEFEIDYVNGLIEKIAKLEKDWIAIGKKCEQLQKTLEEINNMHCDAYECIACPLEQLDNAPCKIEVDICTKSEE